MNSLRIHKKHAVYKANPVDRRKRVSIKQNQNKSSQRTYERLFEEIKLRYYIGKARASRERPRWKKVTTVFIRRSSLIRNI